MSDITKIKVDGEPESSYKLFPKNREFEKRAEYQPDMVIDYNKVDMSCMIIYGTYENVVNKIINDVHPTVHVVTRDSMYKAVFSNLNVMYYYKANLIEIIGGTGFVFNVHPDNTIELSD